MAKVLGADAAMNLMSYTHLKNKEETCTSKMSLFLQLLKHYIDRQ